MEPPEFNTIDFLVSTVKDENNKDKISNIFKKEIAWMVILT